MKKQLLLILFSFLAVAGYARVITGTVISESDNEPVIGATVMVKGTQRGVATDFDGKFTLDVKDSDVLTITNVGMLQQDVKVGKQQSLRIIMKDNAQLLGEVVVTAMGQTQEKKKLNFAVQQLDSKEISAGVSNNLASTLQGKVSGLQILSTGGSPNASQTIQIRAISSINTSQNNEPLIIIDGVPVRGGGSSLTDINPNDIESMSVLKGAAAFGTGTTSVKVSIAFTWDTSRPYSPSFTLKITCCVAIITLLNLLLCSCLPLKVSIYKRLQTTIQYCTGIAYLAIGSVVFHHCVRL